jgi:ABC-2 type transport system ATP-binding protein
MTDAGATGVVALDARLLRKHFRRDTGETVQALDAVSLTVAPGTLAALVGPDGAGKTTLIRLAAGLMKPDAGRLDVLGVDVTEDPQAVQNRIGYMPQRFGLYEDLSVQENLDLYADLHGVSAAQRRERYPQLMQMTALGPFTHRLAGQLSGGMKQKLGLACTLVCSPQLLLLDEPTVGVDPLSRHELWDIIQRLVSEDGLTVLLSTAYLHEAERCAQVTVLLEGRVLAHGPPAQVSELAAGRSFIASAAQGDSPRQLQSRLLGARGIADAVPQGGRVRMVVDGATDPGMASALARDAGAAAVVTTAPRFEDGFMILLRQNVAPPPPADAIALGRPLQTHGGDVVVSVKDAVRQFGRFTAVDHVSFEVRRGEIFGLLGPNGAGKTTLFRMLCGLLPASSGRLEIAGGDLRRSRAASREHIGYVAQKFSLYGQLSVLENLEFFASAYGLRGSQHRERIDWAMDQFALRPLARLNSGQLPGGYKQRLAMAAALLHEPELLFLDEPTSGADPLARRDFWKRITAFAAEGVTVIVTTHFMEEAEYCDRIVILDSGRVLAQGTPGEVRGRAARTEHGEATMEEAFIAVVEQMRARNHNSAAKQAPAT